MNKILSSGLFLLACLLAMGAAAAFAIVTWEVWVTQSDGDMLERYHEYSWFREGTYPNSHVETQVGDRPQRYTVYPPFAIPLFAVFFEPGGMAQGRLVLEGLSLASLALMGWYGRRALAPYGSGFAALGSVLGVAIADNATAIWVGQFSIICVGLVVLQMTLLDRDRPVAAGVCWALAMIKPNIALPFAALFLLGRHFVGAVVGGLVLIALAGVTCWWTEVSPLALLDHWGRGQSLRFVELGYDLGPGAIARRTGLDHRLVLVGVASCLIALVFGLVIATRSWGSAARLPLAAAVSVLGMFACYHRQYDNIMLFPALLAATAVPARTRRPSDVCVAGCLLASLAIPFWVQGAAAWFTYRATACAWFLGGLYPMVQLMVGRQGRDYAENAARIIRDGS